MSRKYGKLLKLLNRLEKTEEKIRTVTREAFAIGTLVKFNWGSIRGGAGRVISYPIEGEGLIREDAAGKIFKVTDFWPMNF